MAWSPAYDGFALTKAAGITFADWSDLGPNALSMSRKVAGGSVVTFAAIEGRRIRADLQVRAATNAALLTLLDSLMAKLQRHDSAVLQLDSNRVIDAWCKPGAISPVPGATNVAKLKVEWLTEDEFWRSSSSSTTTLLNSSASPLTTTIAYAGEANSVVSLEVENIGATDYTGQTFTVKNTTTGKELRIFKLDIAAGDDYHLDADGQSYFDSPTSADSAAPVRVDSVLFELEPGDNDIEISHNFGASSDINFKLSAFGRYPTCGAWE